MTDKPADGVRTVEGVPVSADREALWAKFTGGEKLAYGCGYRDGCAVALDRETLIAAYEYQAWSSPDQMADMLLDGLRAIEALRKGTG